MKRTIIITMVLLLAVSGAYLIAAEQEKAKAEKITPDSGAKISLTGQLSCTFCKLAHPDMTCKPDCCTSCVKAGDPPLLTDADGNMYLLVSGEKEVPLMNPERMKMLGAQVTVKGLLVKGKGIQAIYVDTMEKVKESKEKY